MKRATRNPGLLFLTALLLAGCNTGQEAETANATAPLTGPEIVSTITGNTLHRCGWRMLSRWEYVGTHRPDGTITGTIGWSGGADTASGVWEVGGDNLYCRTWENNWGGGKPGCFSVHRQGHSLTFRHVSGSRGDADQYTYRIGESCK